MSRLLHWVCTVTMLTLPMIFLCGFALGDFTSHALVDAHPGLHIVTPPDVGGIAGYLVIEGVLLAVGLYVLWQLRALFGDYARGDIFTLESARSLLRAAAGLVVLALGGIVAQAAQSVLLTWQNPPGERLLSVTASNGDLGFLLAGGLLLVVGWSLVEAARLAEENRGFI